MAHKDKDSEVYIEYKKRRVASVKKWRENAKLAMVESMGGECQICGYNKSHKALEMHHIDPDQKEKSFGQLIAAPQRLEEWFGELSKCILLCANCHREVHAGVTELPVTYKHFDESVLTSLIKKTNRSVTPKGTIWITDGNDNKKIKRLDTIPEGWYKGRTLKK